MNKHLIAATIILSLTATLVPTFAADAAPKAGGTCSKLGSKVGTGTNQLVCKAKGAKKTWQSMPAQSVAPTAYSAPDGRPTDGEKCPSSMQNNLIAGHGPLGNLVYLSCGPDGHLHPQNGAPELDQATGEPILPKAESVTSPEPQTQAEIIEANCGVLRTAVAGPLKQLCEVRNSLVSQAAMAEIKNRAQVTRETSTNLTVFVSKGLKSYQGQLETMVNYILSFHGADFKGKRLYVSLFTPSDVDAAEKAFLSQNLTNSTLAQWDMVRKQGSWGCGGQAASYVNPVSDTSNYMFVACINATTTAVSGAKELLSHELFHLVQQSNFVQVDGNFPRTNLPNWLSEGSATLMEELGQSGEVPVFYHKIWPGEISIQDKAKSGDASQITELYKTVEPVYLGGADQSIKSYFLGGLASEVLVATFGYDKLRTLSNGLASEADVKVVFKRVYGFEISDFYGRMASYLKWWSDGKKYAQQN